MPMVREISRHARLGSILHYVAEGLGPILMDEPAVQDHVVVRGNREDSVATLRATEFRLDAQECFKITRDWAHALFLPGIAPSVEQDAKRLLHLRNVYAHTKRAVTDADLRSAVGTATSLLRAFGRDDMALGASLLALPPTIDYVVPLRRLLIDVARTGGDLTYSEAQQRLALPPDDVGKRQLYRQLNVLAALQMVMTEPQLCTLVVLEHGGIPGDGFYWILDVPRNATKDIKAAAHAQELRRVRRFDWNG
jgi:hypothetical protein